MSKQWSVFVEPWNSLLLYSDADIINPHKNTVCFVVGVYAICLLVFVGVNPDAIFCLIQTRLWM